MRENEPILFISEFNFLHKSAGLERANFHLYDVTSWRLATFIQGCLEKPVGIEFSNVYLAAKKEKKIWNPYVVVVTGGTFSVKFLGPLRAEGSVSSTRVPSARSPSLPR